MKKAVVTGGAGFIGSNLVVALLRSGWHVHVIDDFSVGKRENLPRNEKNLKLSAVDIRKQDAIQKLLKGAEVVFHLATQCVRKSINDPFFVHSVNTEGTLSVLEAAWKEKVKKVVYVSSSEVYGSALTIPMSEKHPLNPTTIYGASKLAGEYYALSYLRTHGLPVVIVRPFNTYGENAHFEGVYGEVIPRFVLRALNNLSLPVFGDGKQTRDFTFVSDTVDGIFLVSQKGIIGEVYNIARGEEVAITTLAKLIKRLTKKNVAIVHRNPRPGDVKRHFANIRKAKKTLSYQPKITLQEGVASYIEWFGKKHPDLGGALALYEEKNW